MSTVQKVVTQKFMQVYNNIFPLYPEVICTTNDDVFINLLPEEMKELGINIDLVSGYPELIAAICGKKYDLILLTNLGIPVKEIPETVKTIRTIYKTLPIVILVGASVEYAVKDLLNNDVNEIFTIPNDMDFVLKTIKNIIYKRYYRN